MHSASPRILTAAKARRETTRGCIVRPELQRITSDVPRATRWMHLGHRHSSPTARRPHSHGVAVAMVRMSHIASRWPSPSLVVRRSHNDFCTHVYFSIYCASD